MLYSARIIEKNETPGPDWGPRVGVFRGDEQIGEYPRNYITVFNTFCPFQIDGRDYALYSPQYHITRVMELPSCRDIGGEESRGEAFCPTDYFVPCYTDLEFTNTVSLEPYKKRVNEPTDKDLTDRIETYSWIDPLTKEAKETLTHYRPLTGRLYYPFGFVADCVWGDDSTWKIQFLDLSEADKGTIRRDDRFGYIELPEKMRLHQAIDMCDYHYDGEFTEIRISVMKTFDLPTGKEIERP